MTTQQPRQAGKVSTGVGTSGEGRGAKLDRARMAEFARRKMGRRSRQQQHPKTPPRQNGERTTRHTRQRAAPGNSSNSCAAKLPAAGRLWATFPSQHHERATTVSRPQTIPEPKVPPRKPAARRKSPTIDSGRQACTQAPNARLGCGDWSELEPAVSPETQARPTTTIQRLPVGAISSAEMQDPSHARRLAPKASPGPVCSRARIQTHGPSLKFSTPQLDIMQ